MDRAPSSRMLVGAGVFASVAAGLPQIASWASGRIPFDRWSARRWGSSGCWPRPPGWRRSNWWGPFRCDGRLSALAYTGFQLFAFGASRLAVREAEARQELARVHAELLAARELSADSTRTAERLRIARELHDALGHHLSALSLQLELARHLADGRAREPSSKRTP